MRSKAPGYASGHKFVLHSSGRCQRASGRRSQVANRRGTRLCAQKQQAAQQKQEESGAGLKAAWLAAEAFGKTLKGDNPDGTSTSQQAGQQSISWEQCKEGIQQDFNDQYIISGKAAMDVYDPNCEFADPFSSFRGVDRFKRNLANFAKITQDVNIDVGEWEELDGHKLKVHWKFNCLLDLPWKPRLAAKGQVTYEADPSTGLVVRHLEEWDSNPKDVLKLLLKPSSKNPETDIEQFMDAVHKGYPGKAWQAASTNLFLASLPLVAISLGSVALTGHGLPGAVLGATEGLAWLFAAAAGLTIVFRVAGRQSGSDDSK